MLKLILKIEEIFNRIFYTVFNKLKERTSPSVKNKLESFSQTPSKLKEALKRKVKKTVNKENTEKIVKSIQGHTSEFKKKVQSLDTKKIKKELKDGAKETIQKSPQYLKNVARNNALLIFFIIPISSYLVWITYTQLSKLLNIDKIEEEVIDVSGRVLPKKRASYYKIGRQYLLYDRVYIPIYLTKKKAYSSIIFDITLFCSNRYTVQFLAEKSNEVRDYLNTYISPMESSFPLKEEGKFIIKTKVKNLLNAYLEKNNVEGRVLGINIIGVIAN